MTFQTPLGALRLTIVSMRYANAMQIMQGNVTHIMQLKIPEYTIPVVDDVTVHGPAT
jgi:hypothetical protein